MYKINKNLKFIIFLLFFNYAWSSSVDPDNSTSHLKTIIFGAIAIARSRVETIDEVVERLKEALKHIDRERLVVAPDCGLGLLSSKIASEKLQVMVKTAKLV